MSGIESWASTEPSTNSTNAWTIDCGWMTTSSRSGGSPKSQRASMTSNPLFIRVAQSTVMRSPMDQVGCFRTSAGVASWMDAGARRRKGPPDAVSVTRRTSETGRAARH